MPAQPARRDADQPHRAGHGAGHRGLHVARAGARRGGRPPFGHLLLRRGAPRDGRRRAALPPRDPGRDDDGDPQGGARRVRPRSRPRSRRRWPRSSAAAWRSGPASASNRLTTWPSAWKPPRFGHDQRDAGGDHRRRAAPAPPRNGRDRRRAAGRHRAGCGRRPPARRAGHRTVRAAKVHPAQLATRHGDQRPLHRRASRPSTAPPGRAVRCGSIPRRGAAAPPTR